MSQNERLLLAFAVYGVFASVLMFTLSVVLKKITDEPKDKPNE